MGVVLHIHLIAAISWIGGSVLLFIFGIALRDKQDQKEVYTRIGPIYGYFEIVSLITLVITGYLMIESNGLLSILLDMNNTNEVITSLRIKLLLVGALTVMTIIHTVISFQTLQIEKTPLQKLFSRGSSMGIFLLNFIVLHYAMVIRDIL
ncbi:MAG: hypothetical protein ABXS92_04795 [Sulfurimonas sp.]